MRYNKNSSKILVFFSCIVKKLHKYFAKNIAVCLCVPSCLVLLAPMLLLRNEVPMLTLNMKISPKTFDPRKTCDVFSLQMVCLLFEGLVKQYPDGSVQLAQAKSYQVSEDQLTYTFTLGNHVWSNGQPVTAYDFAQSWKDVLDPQFSSPGDYLFSAIKNAEKAKRGNVPLSEVGIKAVDAKTLVIELIHPVPYLLKLLTLPEFFPINIEQDRKHPNWTNHLTSQCIGNGPFIIEKYEQGDKIVFTSNPHYRKTKDKHPKKITFNIVENDYVTLEMFKQGKIDLVGDSLTTIPLEKVSELEKKWSFNAQSQPYSIFIYLNTDKSPLTNTKIRRAFALAINRQELLGLLGNNCKKQIKTDSINLAYHPGLSATDIVPPCLKENRYLQLFKDNDVVQANVLLKEGMAELGITKEAFKGLTLLYSSRIYAGDELARIIQQQWVNALGILIRLEKLDFSLFLDKIDKKDYHMCLASWIALYDHPMSILERFGSKNYAMNRTNWENPKFTKLLVHANYKQGDQHLLTLEKAERILIQDMPIIPIYHRNYVYLINPDLEFNVTLFGDRLLLPMSAEQKQIQKENKHAKK